MRERLKFEFCSKLRLSKNFLRTRLLWGSNNDNSLSFLCLNLLSLDFLAGRASFGLLSLCAADANAVSP